ncbi:anti-sigma B factor antagonist/stage II sporulation protein AA (anti-sigma F factor antagonist) [Parageobacillus thermantarcticus]|uniref:Anti-sigma factor antagonist n=1 Tax=Parageobacillus thermantarcticus TaxID=186116 RepID=A0A1I0TNL5_9BACL|nr:anti-sigma B factor antagonist/stage II sporulation protein AA (anti-sigma F factor antagonist) [Parageobacillus thermantarcticus]
MIQYSLHENGEYLDVKLAGDLDIDGTEVIEEELIPNMEKYQTVNINFEGVRFVDSTGMGLLMNMVQSLKEKGIKVTISNVQQDVMNVFEILQLPEILGEEIFI